MEEVSSVSPLEQFSIMGKSSGQGVSCAFHFLSNMKICCFLLLLLMS